MDFELPVTDVQGGSVAEIARRVDRDADALAGAQDAHAIPRGSRRAPYCRGSERTPSMSSSSAREWIPSFWYTCLEWVFTVLGAT